MISIGAVSEQLDELWMVQEAQHQHLDEKLSVALQSFSVELLNCYNLCKGIEDSVRLAGSCEAKAICR